MLAAIHLPIAFLFSSPLTALFAAVGAVSIPIIIHLLNRRRFRVVTWAAMRFLLAAQRKNSRRMRLEQIILLAVRCLIVLLLLLAMASVTAWAERFWHWVNPEGGKGLAGGGGRTHKILVIDGSFSMGLKVGDSTCFDRARSLAAQLVHEGAGSDAFSVVLMAAPARRIVAEPSEDANKVGDEIKKLKLTHGNSDLASALSTVQSMVQASPAKFHDKEVYFFTDMQATSWMLRQPDVVSGPLKEIRKRARSIFVDVGQEGGSNLALSGLHINEPLAIKHKKAHFIITVHNYGETREINVGLSVRKAEGGRDAKQDVLTSAGKRNVPAPHGQDTKVTIDYTFPEAGDWIVQAEVDHDALEVDDTRTILLTVKEDRVPVLIVNGKPAALLYGQASGWLHTALDPTLGKKDLSLRVPFNPTVLSTAAFDDEELGKLTPYDCVFLCDVPSLTTSQVRRLERFVRQGGSVIIGLGDHIDLGNYNDLLYKGGQGLLPARLLEKQKAIPGYAYQLALDAEADRKDPLKQFRDSKARELLLQPRFQGFVQTEPAPRASPRRVLGFQTVIVPGQEKPASSTTPPPGGAAVLEWQPPAGPKPESGRLRGRVILVTTTLNADWNDWPPIPSYLAFMGELTYFGASARLRERSVEVGEPLEWFLTAQDAGQATVSTPDGRSGDATASEVAGTRVLRWTDTPVSGIYRFAAGKASRLFAVNVPALNESEQRSESDLARTTPEEMRKQYPEWDMQFVTSLGQVVHRPIEGASVEVVRNPIGPGVAAWLLRILLVLVLLEVVLAWQFGHYSAVAAEQAPAPVTRVSSRLRRLLFALPVVLFVVLLGGAFVLIHDAWTGDFLRWLPEGLRTWFEHVLGIPPPAPGEGSHWRLEYSSYLWDSHADPWLAGVLAVAALVLIVLIYRREGGRARPGFRLLLVGLRMGFLLLLLAVLMPQLKLWFERQSWPDVAIVIDNSHSMSTVDPYRDPRIKEAAARLAQQAGLAEADRLQLAQALVTSGQSDWLTSLLTQRKVRLHVYYCSARAHRFPNVTEPEEIRPTLERIQKLKATAENDSSQLGTCVRQVLNDFRGASLASIVLLTDGVTTEGESLTKVAKYAAQVGVPLHLVGIGDAQEPRDIRVHDLEAPESAYVGDTVHFKVKVTAQGYGDLTREVKLLEKGKDKVLAREAIRLDAQHKEKNVILRYKAETPGEKDFIIKVDPLDDEVEKGNNHVTAQVVINEAKQIKVLYVEGYRRYEYFDIKTLLERESGRIKGNKTIDLKVLLLDADADYAHEDRSAIAQWPDKTELFTYDVVILGDVDPHPPKDPKMAQHLAEVADFVREHGGGLLMIAGERYAPSAYRDTPLKDVLPIDVTANQPAEREEAPITEIYRMERTPTGRTHSIFRFSDVEQENERIWGSLKEFYWYASGYTPKRAAEVLAVHPRAAGKGDRRDTGSTSRHPLIVQQFAGAGRCLFFGFNETWRWTWREHQKHFNTFWLQTMRYLARSKLDRVKLRLDRQTPYQRGEPIKITVRFPDDVPAPAEGTSVKVVAERRSPGGEMGHTTIPLRRVEGSRVHFEALLTETPEGSYRFSLMEPVYSPRPHAEAEVQAPPGEMKRLQMNQSGMELAASVSHGHFYTLADADQLLEKLPSGARVTVNAPGPPWLIWNRWWLFLIVLLFLTTEWLLRKQKNLL